MPTRRTALRAGGAIVAGSLAGCLEGVPFVGGGALEFEAAPSIVPSSVLSETGYEEHARREAVVERTFEVGGQTQEVVVTNQLVEYDKRVDLGAAGLPIDQEVRAALCTALTTPMVDVLGKTFNPVADMDSAALARMVQDRYEGIERIEQVGETAATIVGESTTVGEFEARADLVGAGATVDLTLHIAEAVPTGDDLVVAIGAYPTRLDSQERESLFTVMTGIEHQG